MAQARARAQAIRAREAGLQRLIDDLAAAGGDGQNVEIDLTNTTVLVDPKTNRNLYRNETDFFRGFIVEME